MEDQKIEDLLLLSLSISQEDRSRSEELQNGYEETTGYWELIVKYHGDLAKYGNGGIQIEELLAGYAIVTILENLIYDFSRLEEVEYIEKPKRLFFSTLTGRRVSCISEVTAREPYLTGKGVLLAVIDSGIDYQSMEFRREDGSTRIAALWDQTLVPGDAGSAPDGFFTGVEFDSERINQALLSAFPEEIVPSFDLTGHGTAVTAVAAAGGRLLNGQLMGAAPESDLLIVKMGRAKENSFPRTTELMRALTYVVRKALERRQPLAINLSFGNTYGPHDGTSLVERFLDAISEYGKSVICVGSGNEGAAGGHVAGRLPVGEKRRIEWNVGPYQFSFGIQLWKDYTDRFLIRIRTPGGEEVSFPDTRMGAYSYRLEGTQVLCYIGEPSPYSIKQEIYFELIPENGFVTEGVWYIELTGTAIVQGGYDLYLPSAGTLSSTTAFFSPTPEKTLTVPSVSERVITVGAYDARTEAYADFSGRGSLLESVDGQRAAGLVKPDLTAPGVDIMTIAPGDSFAVVSGTSFAVPFVTGSAALMMEWGIVRDNDPYLYGQKVKAYLRNGAAKIRGEQSYPNAKTGYGGLCLADSLPL